MPGGSFISASPFVVILLVLMGSVAANAGAAPTGLPLPNGPASHAPILIQSDADFTAANGIVGGSGTSADPYVIANWTITSPSGDGITVQNTNASFVVRDVLLTNGTPYNAALKFTNVSHAAIERVAFLNGWTYGAMLNAVSDVRVRNSSFQGIGSNVNLLYSSNVTFAGNAFTGGSTVGISVNETTAALLQDNVVSGAFIGISVGYNSQVAVLGNNISQSTTGIGFFQSAGTVADNVLAHNGDGVTIGQSSNVTVEENLIGSSTGTGILLTQSTGIRLYHNNLESNAVQASDDRAPQNTWDGGYPSGGNYWSDYMGVDHCRGPLQDNCTAADGIGDTPYAIPVSAQDRYPLMVPYQPSPPPTASFTLYGDALRGWGESPANLSNPGPTLRVVFGGRVNLTLYSVDGATHAWFVDYNNDSVPSPGEPLSPSFNASSPVNFTFTASKSGTFVYRCAIHPATMTGLIVVGQAPPHTAIVLSGVHGLAGWYTSPVNVTLSAAGSGPGPWTTFYRINGSAWVQYSGSFTIHSTGGVFLEYYSTDSTGDTEPVQNATIHIDLTGPVIALAVSGPLGQNGWYVGATSVFIAGVSSVAQPVAVTCTADGLAVPCYGSGNFTADGRHTFVVNATDAAGINGTLVKEVDIDQTPPQSEVQFMDGTQGLAGWWTTGVLVYLGATDLTSGIQNITWRVDRGPWYLLTSSLYVVITDGVHRLEYRATDNAGNVEAIQNLTFHVDTHAPQLHVSVQGTLGDSGWLHGPVNVSLSATDLVSGVASLEYAVDGASNFQAYVASIALTDGIHVVTYRATDVAGNTAWGNVTLYVDSAAPTVEFSGWSSVMTSSTVVLRWTATDAVSGIRGANVSVDGGPWQPAGANVPLTLADGPHTVLLRVTDVAGNRLTLTAQFRIDTNPLSLTGPNGPWPLIALVVVGFGGGLTAAFLWMRRRKPVS